VIVTVVSPPLVAVLVVRPAPIVIRNAELNLRTTIPDPPAAPAWNPLVAPPPPPPPPVLAVPAVACVVLAAPLPPPPLPPVDVVDKPFALPPPPPPA
jgi:hypothetical protein